MTNLNNNSVKSTLFNQFEKVVIEKKGQKVVKGGIIIVEVVNG